MDILKLKEEVEKLNYTFSNKLTKNGSEYVRVNGFTFRISDHDQPADWTSSHVDASSYQEILNFVTSEFFDGNKFNEGGYNKENSKPIEVSLEFETEYEIGTILNHTKFGTGVVVSEDYYNVFIDFDKIGEKSLLKKFTKFI